jgi:hypothetical protein
MGSRTNVVLLVASIMCFLELIMSRSCPLRTCIHSKYSVCFDCQPTWPRISYKHKPKGRREQGLSDPQARVQQLRASQRVQGGKKEPTCYWRAPMTSTCSNCLLICCRWSTLVFGRFCAQHWETQLQLITSGKVCLSILGEHRPYCFHGLVLGYASLVESKLVIRGIVIILDIERDVV